MFGWVLRGLFSSGLNHRGAGSGFGSSEILSYLVLARSRASVNGRLIWGLCSRTSRCPSRMPSISWEICRSSSRLSLTIVVSLQEVDPRPAVDRNGCDFHFITFRQNAIPINPNLNGVLVDTAPNVGGCLIDVIR